MLQQIFAVVAPVFLIAALGYVWDRKRLPFDTTMVTYLSSNIGAPCLLLSTFLSRRPALPAMLHLMAAAAGVVAIMGLLGYAVLKVKRLPVRAYLPVMVFANTGNMGIPLSMLAFGEPGLVAAVAFFAMHSLLQFSFGEAIASGRLSWRGVATSPVLWAMALALVMIGFDLRLPGWLGNTVEVLAGMVIPLMLLSLGISLARLKITALGRSVAFSLFRIGFGFAVAVGMTKLLGLTGADRGAAIIQSSMPAAVFNYLFAVRYDTRPNEVAGIVVVSTMISFAVLPLLLLYVLG